MDWVVATFDGSGLVLGRLTRRDPRVEVRQVIGEAQGGVHPTATRITGLGRLRTWFLLAALRRRIGRAVRVRRFEDGLVLHMGVPIDNVHSDELRLVMQHLHRFGPPFVLYRHGRVIVHVRANPGTDPADLLSRLPGLDASIVPVVDVSPWFGLMPAAPDGHA